jgi:hypothetical protein
MTISRFRNSNIGLLPGKILQIVRATDATSRSTTSTSFVDASISVTITPQKNDSAILLVWSVWNQVPANNDYINVRITDSSNNAISGVEGTQFGSSNGGFMSAMQTVIAYATPATTSAVTYKGRFKSFAGGSVVLANDANTGQLYAIEVSA